jgi:hypothetical protein
MNDGLTFPCSAALRAILLIGIFQGVTAQFSAT